MAGNALAGALSPDKDAAKAKEAEAAAAEKEAQDLQRKADEAKAKAAETAAKAAYAGKLDSYKLCLAMDRVAASYQAATRTAGKTPPTPTETAACSEPGPFAYAPAEPKPIEAAGAHSPAATAVSPPSTTTSSSDLRVAASRRRVEAAG